MTSPLSSPGVLVREIDISTIIPSVATTEAALVTVYPWGPVGEVTLSDTEEYMAKTYGWPSNFNAENFFSGASFLSYGNRLLSVRAANTSGDSPLVTTSITASNATILLSTGNTSALAVGMTSIASSNSGLANGATIASIVNSTAFTISTASHAAANTTGDVLQFVTNTAMTAFCNTAQVANIQYQTALNEADFEGKYGTYDGNIPFIARFPGDPGNSLRVSVCANAQGYSSVVDLTDYANAASFTINVNSNSVVVTVQGANAAHANTGAQSFKSELGVTDIVQFGNSSIGTQDMKITALSNVTVSGSNAAFTISFEDPFKLAESFAYSSDSSAGQTTFTRYWEYYFRVSQAPGMSSHQLQFGNNSVSSDEMHIVVIDDDGYFSGLPGTVLEVYQAVSRATDAKALDGSSNYYRNVINDRSQYIYAVNDMSGAASATALNLTNSTLDTVSFDFAYGKNGKDENDIEIGVLTRGWQKFVSKEDISDVSLLIVGKNRGGSILANWVIDNVALQRRDCVVFVSPQKGDVVNNLGNEASACVNFFQNIRDTSYAFCDSGYKLMYDRYNDINRWVPLCGDMAGLHARTDYTNDPWWAAGGLNRGQLKNLIKLSWNPREADRDVLYRANINPVASFKGEGTVLWGNKTHQSRPSAFDRMNVRRLFIVLEKAISKAARYSLFEFNDATTRSQFRNMVNPYLRGVQGGRGIQAFVVKCDETNNTPDVVDRNEFVGSIFIKPNRVIDFITLNFICVGSAVSFSAVTGDY